MIVLDLFFLCEIRYLIFANKSELISVADCFRSHIFSVALHGCNVDVASQVCFGKGRFSLFSPTFLESHEFC